MGLLRVLLAVAVLITHGGSIFGINLVPGDIAVEAFFIISGFLINKSAAQVAEIKNVNSYPVSNNVQRSESPYHAANYSRNSYIQERATTRPAYSNHVANTRSNNVSASRLTPSNYNHNLNYNVLSHRL